MAKTFDRAGGPAAWFARAVLALGGVAVALFLRSSASRAGLAWFLLPTVPAAVGLAASRACRRRALDASARLWASLDERRAGGRVPWLATLVFVCLPAAAVPFSGRTALACGDTWPVMATAANLVSSGGCDCDRFVPEAPEMVVVDDGDRIPYCVTRRGGRCYSKYPAGMLAFAVPVAGATAAVGGDFESRPARWRLERLTAAGVTGAALGLFFLIVLRLIPPAPAWGLTMLLAVGSSMTTTTGQGLWQQTGLVFWSLLILWLEVRNHPQDGDRAGKPAFVPSTAQGLAGAMMLSCRLSAVTFLAPFGAWLLWRAPRRAAIVAAAGLVGYLPWAVFYTTIYGNPFGPSTAQLAPNGWAWGFAGLTGALVSPARGLLVFQPWLCLGVFGFRPAGAGPRDAWIPGLPGLAGVILAVAALDLTLVSNWWCWWGGHCWGSRLLADWVPLGAILCARTFAALWADARGRLAVAVCFAAGMAVHLPGLYCSVYGHLPQPPDDAVAARPVLWSWRDAPFLYPVLPARSWPAD